MHAHAFLTLRAAEVASSALRAISGLRPLLGPPNGEVTGFQNALSALQALYSEEPPAPPVRRRAPSRRAPRARVPEGVAPPPRKARVEPEVLPGEEDSPWDPEPLYEASRCQAFLMEIIRRAAHDYVLYRQHKRMDLRLLADHAFIWLFEEEPGHPAWRSRERALFKVEDEAGQSVVEVGSRQLTSFLSICEACELDPDAVRARVREMTVESILHTGRHTERRKGRPGADSVNIETHSVVDVDMDALDADNEKSWSSSSHDYSTYGYDSRESYGMDQSW